jgi:hypothetical protein
MPSGKKSVRVHPRRSRQCQQSRDSPQRKEGHFGKSAAPRPSAKVSHGPTASRPYCRSRQITIRTEEGAINPTLMAQRLADGFSRSRIPYPCSPLAAGDHHKITIRAKDGACNVIDLVSALQESLQQSKGKSTAERKKKPAARKTGKPAKRKKAA